MRQSFARCSETLIEDNKIYLRGTRTSSCGTKISWSGTKPSSPGTKPDWSGTKPSFPGTNPSSRRQTPVPDDKNLFQTTKTCSHERNSAPGESKSAAAKSNQQQRNNDSFRYGRRTIGGTRALSASARGRLKREVRRHPGRSSRMTVYSHCRVQPRDAPASTQRSYGRSSGRRKRPTYSIVATRRRMGSPPWRPSAKSPREAQSSNDFRY